MDPSKKKKILSSIKFLRSPETPDSSRSASSRVPPALRVFDPWPQSHPRLAHSPKVLPTKQSEDPSLQGLGSTPKRQEPTFLSELSLATTSNLTVGSICIEPDSLLHSPDSSIPDATETFSGMNHADSLDVQTFQSAKQALPTAYQPKGHFEQVEAEPMPFENDASPAAKYIYVGSQRVLSALCEHADSREPARILACKLVQATIKCSEERDVGFQKMQTLTSLKNAADAMNVDDSSLPLGVFEWLDEQLQNCA